MTDNYTPSTEEVRLAYAQNYVKTVEYHENGFAEFDRWYTAESARLRAEGAAEALLKASQDVDLGHVADWARHGNIGLRADAEAQASVWLEERAAEYRQSVTHVPPTVVAPVLAIDGKPVCRCPGDDPEWRESVGHEDYCPRVTPVPEEETGR